MKSTIKFGLSVTLGIILGVGACVVSYPYVSPVIRDVARNGVMLIIKPLGGTLPEKQTVKAPHPQAGTFEHEQKRTI